MWPIPPSESLFAAPEEAPQPTLAQAPMPTQNPTPAHTAPAQDFATQGSAPSTAEAGASPAITGGADSWQTAASADQAGQQFAAPAAQFAAPTPVVPAAVNESSSTQISEVGGTAVNDALADALDAAIDAAVGTRSEDSLDAILDSSTARSNAIAQNWAAEAEAVLNESLQQPELTAPAQLQPEMTASVSEATAETSTETGSETGSETAAEKAIEQSSESTESGGHTDVQQPRVRPRDYSSPLRAPKALSAADSITPMTPHQTVNRQNAPTPLQSSPMPTAAYENETAAGTASGSSSTSIPTVSPTGHAVTPTPVPVAQAPAQPLAPEPVQAKATPAPIAPPAAAETTEAATPEITTSVSAATPAQANYTPSAEETAPQATLPSAKTESPAPAETPAAAKPLPFRPKPAAAVGRASSDAHPAVAPPAAASGAQDTRLMMNEMASLMSKLEMQVAKAANKMASRSEELRSRLSQQVDIVVKEAQDVERQAEINLATLASEFKTKLDGLSTEVQNSLAKDGQNAQLTVQEIAQNGWEKLESEQKALSAEITHSAQDFRLELDRLTNTVNSRLDRLIESRNKELIALSDSILLQLKESYDAYNIKVSQRFDRFEQRMDEETSSISGSLERNMRSMVDEIETSLERACEKLKNTKFELEQTVAHTIAVAETSIAQKAKHVLTETLLPRLNEQKEIIRTMIADMAKQVSSESNVGLDLELAKLDQGRARASQNLKKIADECVDELEMMGRSIKSGLEDHFKRVSSDLMVRTREVGDRIRETERRMADSEYALKGLAESSTVDSEPELAEERNHAISKLASLKLEASKVLASTIEQNLDNLDSKGEQLSTELSNKRSELTTHVRESAETNISKIRQALQEATSSIQSAREKYME